MNNKFYKVDLHVHTPASKCYNGDKSDEGYWQILRSAVENDVRVIAITDHNSIEGYEKLMKLKENTLNEYEIIKKYDIPTEQKNKLLEKVQLFDKVSIIPGVEITLNPGIHIIILCDDDSKADLDSLLDEVGYTSDNRGYDTDFLPDMDIKTFLSNYKLSEKIVLAPHVDSDKGIWEALEGTYRAAIFKSSVISAITCNNAKQLEKIKELTKNDLAYKRTTPFVCINASDAHTQNDIGSKHSYFKLSSFSFLDLKMAFSSPEEYISDTEKQDFIDYVKKCSEYNATIYLNDIESLEDAFYAILNTGYGCILLGINENYYQFGVALSCKDIEDNANQVLTTIKKDNNSNFASVKCNTEQLGNGKSVGVIIIESEESKLWINSADKLYIYDAKLGYKMATIREVEELVKSRILSEFQTYEIRTNQNVEEAMTKMQYLLNPISKYMLYDRIKAASVPVMYYFDIKPITKINRIDRPNVIIPPNGQACGNVYYAQPMPPRLDDTYLRYSCPVYLNNDEDALSQLLKFESPVIVITWSGGFHIIDAKDAFYFESQYPSIILKPNKQFYEDGISLHHIIAWLKTDCFLWTCLQKSNDTNAFSPAVILDCFVPYVKDYYNNPLIKEKVEKILSLEYDFLLRFSTECENISEEEIPNNDMINDMITAHNNSVNSMANDIEIIINNCFEINCDEETMIKHDLENEGVFTYQDVFMDRETEASEEVCV